MYIKINIFSLSFPCLHDPFHIFHQYGPPVQDEVGHQYVSKTRSISFAARFAISSSSPGIGAPEIPEKVKGFDHHNEEHS